MVCDLRAPVERDLAVVAAFFEGIVLVLVLGFAAAVFAGLAELWLGLVGDAA
jgi:hypothetical protein